MFCEKCKGYLLYDSKCSCEKYQYSHEDDDGELTEIWAKSFDDAAEKFAKIFNDENQLIDSEEMVSIYKDGVVKIFCVGAELDIHYRVKEF